MILYKDLILNPNFGMLYVAIIRLKISFCTVALMLVSSEKIPFMSVSTLLVTEY